MEAVGRATDLADQALGEAITRFKDILDYFQEEATSGLKDALTAFEGAEESEYRELAFRLERPTLNRLTLLLACECVIHLLECVYVEEHERRSMLSISLWVGELACCVCAYVTMRRVALRERSASILCVVLFLSIGCTSISLHSHKDETPGLAVLYLTAPMLLVPLFPWRLVAPGVLATYLLHVVIASVLTDSLLLARELTKGAALTAVGLVQAAMAEKQHRTNFKDARKFRDELEQRRANVGNFHRLLLNTLPAPIVHEIARGSATGGARHYEDVTVLQADLVGFTSLSASLPAHDILQILGDLFAEFDEVSLSRPTARILVRKAHDRNRRRPLNPAFQTALSVVGWLPPPTKELLLSCPPSVRPL